MANPALKIDATSNDVTSLVIDGQRAEQFFGETIFLSLDNVGDGFSFTVPFYPDAQVYRELFRPFAYQECLVYIGNELKINGRIEKVAPTLSGSQRAVNVQGRSKTAIIVDCCFTEDETKEFRGAALDEIATELLKPFGLKAVFPDGPGAIFEQAGPKSPADTKFSFLQGLARQRGLLISQNSKGDVVFSKPKTDAAPVAELIEGHQGLLISSATYDGTKRFSQYEAYGQEFGKNDNYIKVDDPAIKIFRPKALDVNNTNQGNIEDAARWALSADIASAISIPLAYEGWLRPDGKHWEPGDMLLLKAPSLMFYKSVKLMVKSVTYKNTATQKTVELGLVLPEAYSGTIPRGYPWDE